MNSFFEPANIDTVLGVFTKTLAKLEERAKWLTDDENRLEEELNRIGEMLDRHKVEVSRINRAGDKIKEIVGG